MDEECSFTRVETGGCEPTDKSFHLSPNRMIEWKWNYTIPAYQHSFLLQTSFFLGMDADEKVTLANVLSKWASSAGQFGKCQKHGSFRFI